MLDSIRQDVRHGWRVLVKNATFSLVAIVSIAFGVGASAAMFSLADGMVLRPLQVPRASEIVAVSGAQPGGSIRMRAVSYPDYRDLRDRARSFSGLLAYRVVITSVAERPGEAARSQLGLAVSGNFFDVLQLQAALGRTFVADDDRVPGRDAVVVLSHQAWMQQFGGDPGILNRRIRLGGREFTVIGVAPGSFPGMDLALHPAYYVPLAITPALAGLGPDLLDRRDARTLTIKGRLHRGVSLEQAGQEAEVIARELQQAHPETNRGFGLIVRTDLDERMEARGASTPVAFMLMTFALVVLIVACANVAGLLASRSPVRAREIAVRMAIGGSSRRIVRQLIVESALIGLVGGVLGIVLAYGAIERFSRMQLVSDIGVKLTFVLDRRVLVVAVLCAAASTLLSSAIPVWRATRWSRIAGALKAVPSIEPLSRLWGRNVLVVGQVALSLMLLTVAVSLHRTMQAAFGNPGFKTSGLVLMSVEPPLAGLDQDAADAFYQSLVERAAALPGVTSVGMTSAMPLSQDYREASNVVPEGYEFPAGVESATILSARVDEGFFETMGIQVVKGRGIRAADTGEAPRVAVVNATLAERYWPGRDPIGRRVRIGTAAAPWTEIVGIAADSKYNWIAEAPTPFLYLPHRQEQTPRATLLVETPEAAGSAAAALRALVHEIDPDVPIASIRSIEDFYTGSAVNASSRLLDVVGAIGTMGTALAMVGLYALVAYRAARRTREIGVRIAVGATPASVLRLVLRHAVVLATAGTLVAIAGSADTHTLVRATFPASEGIDVVTYALVLSAVWLAVIAAAYVPARRAARTDPLLALRTE